MGDNPSYAIEFTNGYKAQAIPVSTNTQAGTIAESLNLPQPQGMLVLSGGASDMGQVIYNQLQSVFNVIANFVTTHELIVIDGGIDAGIMSLMGKALGRNGRPAIHIGVLPAKAQTRDGSKLAEEMLEPHHSHFVLINSHLWGDEVQPMYRLIRHFSIRTPIIALLINGGDVSLKEIQYCVKLGYKIIVFAGTGRLADEVALAIRYPEKPRRPEIAELIPQGRFLVYNISSSTAELKKLLEEQLIFETGR